MGVGVEVGGGGKVIEHKMCVLIFCTIFLCNVSHFKDNSTRYYHKCAYFFTPSTRYSSLILVKLQFFSSRFSEKYTNIKFHENPSSWSQVVPFGTDGNTDGHDEAHSRFFGTLPMRLKNSTII